MDIPEHTEQEKERSLLTSNASSNLSQTCYLLLFKAEHTARNVEFLEGSNTEPNRSWKVASFSGSPALEQEHRSKLCRQGEPGIFCHMNSIKGREGVDRETLFVCGCTWRLRSGKRVKVASCFLPVLLHPQTIELFFFNPFSHNVTHLKNVTRLSPTLLNCDWKLGGGGAWDRGHVQGLLLGAG